VDIYIILDDTVSNHFYGVSTEHLSLFATISAAGLPHEQPSPERLHVVDRSDGFLTLHARRAFSRPIVGEEITVGVRFQNMQNFWLGIVDLDLTIAQEVDPIAEIFGVPILPPHMHDIPFSSLTPLETIDGEWEDFARLNTYISSIGIIDGNLHIQTHSPNLGEADFVGSNIQQLSTNALSTLPTRRDHVLPQGVAAFDIDDYGNIINTVLGSNMMAAYVEHVFEGVYLDAFETYSAFGSGGQLRIFLTLDETFEVAPYDGALIVENLDAEARNFIVREVRMTPFTVLIKGETPGMSIGVPGVPVRIHTTEGIIQVEGDHELRVRSTDASGNPTYSFSVISNIFDEGLRSYSINANFNRRMGIPIPQSAAEFEILDLDTVTSIEVAGVVVPLR